VGRRRARRPRVAGGELLLYESALRAVAGGELLPYEIASREGRGPAPPCLSENGHGTREEQ